MSDNEIATKRIALKPTTFEEMRDFCNGLTANYSEVLDFLLFLATKPNEDKLTAGRRLRDDFNKWSAKQ